MEIVHNLECCFYKFLNNSKIIPVPKIFYTLKTNNNNNENGIIIMEDLTKDVTIISILDGFNEKQV